MDKKRTDESLDELNLRALKALADLMTAHFAQGDAEAAMATLHNCFEIIAGYLPDDGDLVFDISTSGSEKAS